MPVHQRYITAAAARGSAGIAVPRVSARIDDKRLVRALNDWRRRFTAAFDASRTFVAANLMLKWKQPFLRQLV